MTRRDCLILLRAIVDAGNDTTYSTDQRGALMYRLARAGADMLTAELEPPDGRVWRTDVLLELTDYLANTEGLSAIDAQNRAQAIVEAIRSA